MNDPYYIYLYASQSDPQEGLPLGGEASVDPELLVILVSRIPNSDQKALLEQDLPNELARLLLYLKTGITFAFLPICLQEGIATQVEFSQNPDFDFALANAVEKQILTSLSDRCVSYPKDTYSIFLAYAQANSYTSYFYNKYGQAGMEKLIQTYTSGVDCEQGAKTALGKTLTQLEYNWLQATFSKNALRQTITYFLTYLFFLLLILLIPLLNKPKVPSPIDFK